MFAVSTEDVVAVFDLIHHGGKLAFQLQAAADRLSLLSRPYPPTDHSRFGVAHRRRDEHIAPCGGLFESYPRSKTYAWAPQASESKSVSYISFSIRMPESRATVPAPIGIWCRKYFDLRSSCDRWPPYPAGMYRLAYKF